MVSDPHDGEGGGFQRGLTWKSLSSVGSRTPSLLTSHSLKIRRSASTHFGLRAWNKQKQRPTKQLIQDLCRYW